MPLPDMSRLVRSKEKLLSEKESIVHEWVESELCVSILERHEIEPDFFRLHYAESVFDYFMGVVAGNMAIGECPVIADLINYLKNKDLRADELFVLCTHFNNRFLIPLAIFSIKILQVC